MAKPNPPQQPDQGDAQPSSLGITEGHNLLTSFNTFLTIAIHNILFYREIYPPRTFLSARAYNLPVHQSRHPKVCSWIQDAVDAVAVQLAEGNVSRVAVVLHAALKPKAAKPAAVAKPPPPPPAAKEEEAVGSPSKGETAAMSSSSKSDQKTPSKGSSGENEKPGPDAAAAEAPKSTASTGSTTSGRTKIAPGAVLERWMFDVGHIPAWPGGARAMKDLGNILANEGDVDDDDGEDGDRVELVGGGDDDEAEDELAGSDSEDDEVNWADVDEQFRGAIQRMAHTAEKLAKLPDNCTFTVAVELKDEGKPPIGVGTQMRL